MSSFDGLPAHRTVGQAYDHLIEIGTIRDDPAQRSVVAALDRLVERIASKRLASKASSLGWLFGKRRQASTPLKGLYVHGGVGRGKTMLMDLFFDLVPVRRKRRAHFNDFMADVHDRIQRHRDRLRNGETRETDPIPPVARDLAAESWVLCFDEFTVTDIADAMVLSRLFSSLFDEGVVLVATSNVAPDDLYRDGLNRGLFEPFIAILENHADVMSLDGRVDYRREKLDRMQVYMTPLGPEADRLMDDAWEAATAGHATDEARLPVKGREIVVPRANRTVARFTFEELCARPLGARDYLAIAARFDTLFVDGIPAMGRDRRNEAKRFILLVDTLYDTRTRLVATAETPPEGLYAGTTGTEAFEFARTASRLTEMQSRQWLATTRGHEGSGDEEPRAAPSATPS
jgi:cell division protein ZapE